MDDPLIGEKSHLEVPQKCDSREKWEKIGSASGERKVFGLGLDIIEMFLVGFDPYISMLPVFNPQ